jgi:hypothetical protein
MIFRGIFRLEAYRNGQHQRTVIAHNTVTDAALDVVLDIMFRNTTQLPNWYFGLIRDDNFTGITAADTMASHAGWEEGTEYSEATRQQWLPPAASGGKLANTAEAIVTVDIAQTFKGLFIASDNTKGGITGTLWAAGLLAADQTSPVGETLKLFYDLTARSG